MASLRRWLDTDPPNTQRLLDVALIVALLPHLAMARPAMLLYGLVVLALLLRKREVSGIAMALMGFFGLVAVAGSFLGAFNFVGLSELSTFIQLVSSLLLYAVSLQRLSRKINFYLAISPMLLLALSYFFYNSIFMLVYAIAALYIFMLLLLWQRMRAPLVEAVRSATVLFAGALPVVALLFMVFPRISFQKTKDFGFKDTAAIRTGHDGVMHIGSEALLVPSKRVAMEVWFENGLPGASTLYFRGSVLYEDRGERWMPVLYGRRLGILGSRPLPGATEYRITLYPHKKRWLYLLDYPVAIDRQANYGRDLVATWDTPIGEVFRYGGASLIAPGSTTDVEPHILEAALQVHRGRDPQSEAAMAEIRRNNRGLEARFEALVSWFQSRALNYTLDPGTIDLDHPVDSFVFGTRKGYCVHFASAFATMARMLGIPSRIVTGFKGDRGKSVENYLVIREEDAHAWVEVRLPSKGWTRFDPTALSAGIAPNDTRTQAQLLATQKSLWQKLSEQANLYVMYTKYVIHKWVLYYDRSRQMQLLRKLLNDTLFALQLAGAFMVLVAAGAALFVTLRRQRCGDRVLCAMRPLLARLAKRGIVKERGEDMHAFLRRASEVGGVELGAVDAAYHRLRYGRPGRGGMKPFENLVRRTCNKIAAGA